MTSEMLAASQKPLPTWSLASFLRSHSHLSIPGSRIKTLTLCICAFGFGHIIMTIYLPAAVPNSSYSKGEQEPALPSAEVTSSEENSHQQTIFSLCNVIRNKQCSGGFWLKASVCFAHSQAEGCELWCPISCFLWKMSLYKLENCYGVINRYFLSWLPGLN